MLPKASFVFPLSRLPTKKDIKTSSQIIFKACIIPNWRQIFFHARETFLSPSSASFPCHAFLIFSLLKKRNVFLIYFIYINLSKMFSSLLLLALLSTL